MKILLTLYKKHILENIALIRYNISMIKDELKNRNLSVYKCSKMSNIPYTTLLELVNNKSKFENCSIKTINKLATILNIPIGELIANELEYRMPFEEFRSEICHQLKSMGDINFVKHIITNNLINMYYNKGWFEETLYSLALLDYVSERNKIPFVKEYSYLRNKRLKYRIFPRDINLLSKLNKKSNTKKDALSKAIPMFLKYNIVETNINDVY